MHVPIDVLARLGGDEFVWQVPALREELVTALIRSLPKDLRRNFVPVPDTARAVLAAIEPAGEPLLSALQRELRRRTGVLVPVAAFDLDKLPPHLRVTFAVESPDGAEVASGKDLQELQERLTTPARRAVAHAVAGELERTGLRDWPDDLDELPRVIERAVQGRTVRGFPAFVDTGGAVDLRVLATPDEQNRAIGPGLRRLIRLSVASPVKAIARQLDPRTRLTLGTNPDGDLSALLEDCADAAADTLMPTPVWTRGEFVALQERLGKTLAPTAAEIARAVERVLAAAHDVRLLLPANPPPAHSEAIADVRAQLDRLLPPGFVTATGRAHLADLTRYLLAIRRRLDGLARGAQADRERMDRVHAVQDAYDELLRELPRTARTAPDVLDIARQIEELRVSLWAQQLGTPRPVSEQRIYRAMDAVRDRR